MISAKKTVTKWKSFLTEGTFSPEKERIKIGKLLNNFLFKSLDRANSEFDSIPDDSPDIIRKYKYLHWAIYGADFEKEALKKAQKRFYELNATGNQKLIRQAQRVLDAEQKKFDGIYRPELGMRFVKLKVNYFLKNSGITLIQKSILKKDLSQLIEIIKTDPAVPKFSVQTPVELTGHGVEPMFRVPMFGRQSIDDWGMGGTLSTPKGQNYLVYAFELLKRAIRTRRKIQSLSNAEVRELYFMSQTLKSAEKQIEEPSKENPHFKKLSQFSSYEEMIQSLMNRSNNEK